MRMHSITRRTFEQFNPFLMVTTEIPLLIDPVKRAPINHLTKTKAKAFLSLQEDLLLPQSRGFRPFLGNQQGWFLSIRSKQGSQQLPVSLVFLQLGLPFPFKTRLLEVIMPP